MKPVVRPDGKARITPDGKARLGCCCGCACCFYNPDGTFNRCQGMAIQDCLAAGGYPARGKGPGGEEICIGTLCCDDPEAPPPCYYCPRTVVPCSLCSTKLPERAIVEIPAPEWCGPGDPPPDGWGFSEGCVPDPQCTPGTGGPTCWDLWISLLEAYPAAIAGSYILPVSQCSAGASQPGWNLSVTGPCCGRYGCVPSTYSIGQGGALSVQLWAQNTPPPPPYYRRFFITVHVQAIYADISGTSEPIAVLPWVGGNPPLLDCRGIAAIVPLVSTYPCSYPLVPDTRPHRYEWNGAANVAFA